MSKDKLPLPDFQSSLKAAFAAGEVLPTQLSSESYIDTRAEDGTGNLVQSDTPPDGSGETLASYSARYHTGPPSSRKNFMAKISIEQGFPPEATVVISEHGQNQVRYSENPVLAAQVIKMAADAVARNIIR